LCKYFDIPERGIEIISKGVDLKKDKKLEDEYEINLQSCLLTGGDYRNGKTMIS